jgi:hypothetical protein
MAVVMHEPQIREIFFAPALLGNHMMNVKCLAIFQVLVADRTDRPYTFALMANP